MEADGRRGRHLHEVVRSVPLLTRLGVFVLFVGVAVDLAAHLAGAAGDPAGPALMGHAVTLGGMALSVAGAITLALRHRPRSAGERRS